MLIWMPKVSSSPNIRRNFFPLHRKKTERKKKKKGKGKTLQAMGEETGSLLTGWN